MKGGGAEKAIKIIVEGLHERKYAPVLVLMEGKMDYLIDDKVAVFSLSNSINKYNFITLIVDLFILLKQLSPDIVYATNTKSQMLLLFTKPFLKTERIVNFQVDLIKQYEGRGYVFKLYSRLLKFADGYSFISHGIYDSLKNKIPKKPVAFIPNAIDFNEVDRLKIVELHKKYDHIYEKKVFITVGRLSEQKGHGILIDAFSRIKEDANLIIIGSGRMEVELKKLAKKVGVENRVFFLGFKRNPFVFLYRADVFVLSSLWEGFGNVIVEAMRCSLPIISSDCSSGPREILAPNSDISRRLVDDYELCEFGVLTPVSNASLLATVMSKLINDNYLIKKYNNQSFLRSCDYNKDNIVDQYINKFYD